MKIIFDKDVEDKVFNEVPLKIERRNDLTIDILSAYKYEYHHCNISARTSFDGIALGKRVKSLIADFELIEALHILYDLQSTFGDERSKKVFLSLFNINLTLNQYLRLKNLGFNQHSTSCLWDKGYHYLKKYFQYWSTLVLEVFHF